MNLGLIGMTTRLTASDMASTAFIPSTKQRGHRTVHSVVLICRASNRQMRYRREIMRIIAVAMRCMAARDDADAAIFFEFSRR